MREALKRPTPLKSERRHKFWSKILWLIFGLLIIFVGLGLLSHLPKVRITQVESTGLQVLNGDNVNQKVLEYLSGNTILVYARSNIFIYSKSQLTDYIKNEFPSIYSVVSIDRVKTKLVIKLEERRAALTWCGKVPPDYKDRFEEKDCYFIDQEGFIFSKAPFFTPGVYLTIYGGTKDDLPIIGQTVILKNSVMDYDALSKTLSTIDLPIHSLVIKDDGQNEFLLNIVSSTGEFPKILFNEDESVKELLVKIESTAKEETFTDEFDSKSNLLEYIDTRFDNRVFYKFKE